MPADSPINSQLWSDVEQQDSSKSYALSGKIMLTSIITLFVVVVFLILLHLYARWYLHRLHRLHRRRPNPRNRSTRIVYYIDSNRPLADSPTGGLHASVLKSLPLFIYSPESGSNTPECAVCLSEFESGETGRVLPNCKHRFHTGCIDMWFFSNSTCPLCRSPVEPVQSEIPILSEPGSSASVGYLETTSSSDRRKRVDVTIDVPNRNNESVVDNEFRSPGSRLLSLKRIINMNRKSPVVSPSVGVGPSCVPVAAELDLESAGQESSRQGTGG